jgi:hypothetical protein
VSGLINRRCGADFGADAQEGAEGGMAILRWLKMLWANDGCEASWSFNQVTKRRCPVARITSSYTTKPSVALDNDTTIIAVI